jgi:cation diffusion facilitator CzcD-associated flavoprotein CzcO
VSTPRAATEDQLRAATIPDVDAIVIGAGFSGLYTVHKLRNELGLSVTAFEASDTVGGTWNWNRYPGARCDAEGYIYCFSFDPDLCQEWTWTGKYPQQEELLSYLEHVADRYDLRRDIVFNTYVTRARFDSDHDWWVITTDTGNTVTARYLVTAVGHLSIARYIPAIEGLENYRGEWHHTSRWPREGVDLAGKRVGVIGTGSSGVQTIPVIADTASHLTVFQRSPQYSIPARHETVDPEFLASVKRDYPQIWEACRHSAGGFPWQHNGQSALSVSDEERLATYEKLWTEGGVKFALGSYRDLSLDVEANATISDFVRSKIAEVVKDPDTRDALIPTDHPFLSRRPIVDTNYFETYNRDNVDLVDLRKTPITHMTEHGIATTEREIPLDVIVFATGFDAVTGPFFNIDIEGRDGVKLTEHWSDGPQTYLGLLTVGFPNMFMVTGPTSVTGNIPQTIENHVDWIAECIAFMQRDGLVRAEPTQEAERSWMDEVAAQSERSLMSRADSWFNGSNIPGKARGTLFYLGHFGKYRSRIIGVARDGFPGLVFHDAPAHSAL